MKKSLIALAVAGALAAPMVAQADATLYGSLRVKVVDADGSKLDVADNASRIGIKGSVDTGIDGVKAIYHGEWKVNTADGADFGAGRLAYVGLTGGFGTAAIGQQWTPYYTFVTGATDILDGNSSAPTQEITRKGNAIAYVSPEMGGFQAALVALADDGATKAGYAIDQKTGVIKSVPAVADKEDVDHYNVAAKYSVAGFTVGASLLTDEATDNDMTAVSASYAAGPLYVAALYQDKEAADVKQWELAGSYAFGDTTVLANYIDFDNDGNGFGLEVQHKLGKQSRVFANIYEVNSDAEKNDKQADAISVGMRVDF